jgi:hypothetical protein
MGACGKLFDIDANAAGLTTQQRAATIQRNLDYALIHTANRGPASVEIAMVNRNPVVTLGGYHIATADGNSAARHNLSQLALAEQWAASIRVCLGDRAAMDKYVSMLTGAFPPTTPVPRHETIAYARAGMFFPMRLKGCINSECSQIGDCVEAVLTKDIPLPTSYLATTYEAYLPCGTVARGQLIDASNSYLGRNAFSIRFDRFITPDGRVIPIEAHVFGGVGTWVAYDPEAPTVVEATSLTSGQPVPENGVVASKGTVCGGWRGLPNGGSTDIPYQKLAFKRRTGVVVPAGECFLVQLSAPTVVSLCTNCGGPKI